MNNKYEFKATKLIADHFEKCGVKFRVINMPGQEEVLAGFCVTNGPKTDMKFISTDNDNDVGARIFGLVGNISKEKRSRALEACNIMNRKVRHMKFYVNTGGDINIEYDFPVHTSDDCVGEIAFEIFIRTMRILNEWYSKIFTKALYTDEELKDDVDEQSISDEMLHRIEDLTRRLEARIHEHEAENNTEETIEPDDNEDTADIDDFITFLGMLNGETETGEGI